jgi:uncharacterized protein (DUF1800 family)
MSAQSPAWIAAARIVRRSGFGATGRAVDAAVRLGTAGYLEQVLGSTAADPGASATPVPRFPAIPAAGRNAARADKLARNQAAREQLRTLTAWWVRRMVAVHQPWPEKRTFCWHDHFATAATKVRRATLMAQQNETLRDLGQRDFRTLAQAILVDPAMLDWLDGEKNTVRGANENLSREFMELFALGHGDGYTETDVREGARALTGWRIAADGSSRLRPALHDQGSKTVLGVTGNLDQAGYCDAVLGRPESARFVCASLWRQYVSDTGPDQPTLDRLVAAYGAGRQLTGLFTALFTDPGFAQAANSFVVGPVDWLIGAVRALRVPVADDAAALKLATVLRGLGQLPLYPPNVSGWPSGQAWLSTAAADLRMAAAADLAKAGDLSFVTAAAAGDRIDAVGYLLGIGRWSDRSSAALKPAVGNPERLVTIALNAPEYLVQ